MGAFSKFSLTEKVYKVGKNSQITYRTSSVMEIKAGKIFIFIDWCLRESGYMPFRQSAS